MCTAIVSAIFTILGVILTLSVQRYTAKEQEHNKFRLAALDKRLETHQEAFLRTRQLISALHDNERRAAIVFDCEAWWENNCLYLDAACRDKFRECLFGVFNYDGQNPQKREEVWPKLMELPKLIISAVSLPAIGGVEATLGKSIQELDSEKAVP